jgi:hypothetical protein
MIYMIFKNIKDEFDATRFRPDDQLVGKQPAKDTVATVQAKPKESNAMVWVGAGAAVVGAGVAAYFIFGDSPETRKIDAEFGK